MTNELNVLKQLATVIETHLNEHLDKDHKIVKGQVVIDFPDVDKMPFPTTIYVQPVFSEPLEDKSATTSDTVDFTMSIFVLCKRDTQSNLVEKSFLYYNAIYYLLRTNTSLDGYVGSTRVNDSNFYAAIEGNRNVSGSEISITSEFEKDF